MVQTHAFADLVSRAFPPFSHRVLGPGELFGEISFFTEIPQMETVR